MRLDTGLRLSTYLTVALAGVGLTYAEEPYFPEITFVAIPLGILLITAYWVDGSWSLSAQGANGLGIIISLGWIVWVMFFSSDFDDPLGRPLWPAIFLPYLGPLLMVLVLVKLFRPKGIRDYWYLHIIGLIEVACASVLVVEAPFGIWLIAYLVCAFWSMAIFYLHRARVKVGIANAKSELAIVGEPRIIMEKGPALARAATASVFHHSPDRIPWGHLGIWSAAWRTGGVAGLALVLFLLTPQHGTTELFSELGSLSSKGQTGFDNAAMDLNTTGHLEVDDSEAFEVYVENNDGTPKTDLSPNIRWRGLVMAHYGQGRWIHPGHQLIGTQPQDNLPTLGPDQFFIIFHVDTGRSHGLFLAEPIVVIPTKEIGKFVMPYVARPGTFEGVRNPNLGLFQYQQQEDMIGAAVPQFPIQVSYQQVAEPSPPNGLSRPSPLSPTDKQTATQWERTLTWDLLNNQPVLGIRQFTDSLLLQLVREGKLIMNDLPGEVVAQLVRQGKLNKDELTSDLFARLVRQGKLTKDDLPSDLMAQLLREEKLKQDDLSKARPAKDSSSKDSRLLPRIKRAKVARALSDYLALSGQYSYSLNLTREDVTKDPTEDFLVNVKEGHCERFATALVLMLRSAGIPCRLVVGFRGAESKNPEKKDGWYVIRQRHAHTWVEALVGTEAADRKMELRWLTLDPSPLTESADRVSFSWTSWRENTLRQLRSFWRSYILEYDSKQQAEAVNAIWTQTGLAAAAEAVANWVQREPYWLAGLTVMVAGLAWLGPRFGRRRHGNLLVSETDFYHRLLSLLARRCRLAPMVGQTPREFGQTAQEFLTAQNLGTDLAGLPVQVIQCFYQVRYGRLPLDASQSREIERQLDLLGAALKKTPRLAN